MIEDIFNNLQIENWDWIAFLVAVFSLCVAIRSFIVARGTLASQKKTEENTKPIMNKDVQELLMNLNFLQIFDAFINLNALKHCLEQVNYSKYPYRGIIEDLLINSDFIHLDVFYKKEDIDNLHAINGFFRRINKYNSNINHFFHSIQNQELEEKRYIEIIDDCINDVNTIARYWKIIMEVSYQYDDIKLHNIISRTVEFIKDDKRENQIIKDNIFIEFTQDKEQKAKILERMNARALVNSSEFSKLLIDYERN